MFTYIINSVLTCFNFGVDHRPFEALQKKDDDRYVRALADWHEKYPVSDVDSEQKLDLMIQELLEIPIDTLELSEIQNMGKMIHQVASKRRRYKEMLKERLKEHPQAARMWSDKVYLANPKQD